MTNADIQNMRYKKACEIVFGDNTNVGYITIYLHLPDRARTSCVACSVDSPLAKTDSNLCQKRRAYKIICTCCKTICKAQCVIPTASNRTCYALLPEDDHRFRRWKRL